MEELDHWSIYGLVFFSPVASLSFWKILWDQQKNWFRLVATGLLSCHMLDLTYAHIYSIFKEWSRIGWDMAKNNFVHVFCCKFTWAIIPATLVRALTPLVSPNEKTFKVVLVYCSHDPSWLLSSPTIYFWWLFRIFCICLFSSTRCSHHLPAIFWQLLTMFALVCLHHHLDSSHHSLFIVGGFLGYFGLVFFFLLAVPNILLIPLSQCAAPIHYILWYCCL